MQFVTVLYGVLDADTHTLTYVRAGHERPFLLRDGKVQALAGEGIALGVPDIPDLHLKEERVDLQSGDRLVLYTDGLADTLSPAGEEFGLGRLRELLVQRAGLPLDEMCRSIFDEVNAYQGTMAQYDDMTLLAVAVK